MRPLTKTIQVETKLLVCDVGTTLWVALPPLALWGLGAGIPGFGDPQDDLGGLRLVDVYLPILLVFTLALTATMSVASTLATYRHQGVLRRLRTTPVGPLPLLGAQLVAQLLSAAVAVAVTIAVAVGVLDTDRDHAVAHFDGEEWKSHMTDDGLPDGRVNDLTVDDDGTVWVATSAGLASFHDDEE